MDVLARACAWLCHPPEQAQAALFSIPNSFEATVAPARCRKLIKLFQRHRRNP